MQHVDGEFSKALNEAWYFLETGSYKDKPMFSLLFDGLDAYPNFIDHADFNKSADKP